MENKMLAWKLREISRSTGSAYKKQLFRKAARRIEEQGQLLEKARELLAKLEKALPAMDDDCSFCDYGQFRRPCFEMDDFPECAECSYDCFCKECTAKGTKWVNSIMREVIEGVCKGAPSSAPTGHLPPGEGEERIATTPAEPRNDNPSVSCADSPAGPAPLLSALQTFSPMTGKSALYTREPMEEVRNDGGGSGNAEEE